VLLEFLEVIVTPVCSKICRPDGIRLLTGRRMNSKITLIKQEKSKKKARRMPGNVIELLFFRRFSASPPHFIAKFDTFFPCHPHPFIAPWRTAKFAFTFLFCYFSFFVIPLLAPPLFVSLHPASKIAYQYPAQGE
jgi:hypothetical protein